MKRAFAYRLVGLCILIFLFVPAYARTLREDLLQYDWISLGDAAGIGVAGGVMALVVSLATDKRIVKDILLESVRNLVVSPIGGAGAYLAMDAMSTSGWVDFPTVLRFLIIAIAGWAGVALFVWAKSLVTSLSVVVAEWIIKRTQK